MLSSRNSLAFLLFGLCNSYAFVIMLSAAGDIVVKQKPKMNNKTDVCYEEITEAHCLSISTGAVLLANIIPCILVQITFLFFMQRVPFGIRHALVVMCQSLGLLIVAFSNTVSGSLTGVVFASLGAGIGAVNCLALSSHFPKSVVAMWSTGSGAAGITSSLSYAAFTEPHFAHLSTKTTLLIMLIIPFFYSIAYWIILEIPDSVHKIQILNLRTYIIKDIIQSNVADSNQSKSAVVEVIEKDNDFNEMQPSEIVVAKNDKKTLTFVSKLKLFVILRKFTFPIFLVYFAQFLINQGLTQLTYFNCSHGFNLSLHSQYRWFQVIYQLGDFLSRSTVHFFHLPQFLLFLCPVLQLSNATFLIFNAVLAFVPHIGIIFPILFFEGLIAGSTYGNTFYRIHTEVPSNIKEFAMSTITVSNGLGIVFAAFSSIPLHNFICNQQISRL